jgi:hypothetical protein
MSIEKRKIKRFTMALPSIVWPQTENSEMPPLYLISRDVSSNGAFFLTPTSLDAGTRVGVILFLELGASTQQKASKAQVTLNGIITRVEKEGMAVCFEKKFKISPLPLRSPIPDFNSELFR